MHMLVVFLNRIESYKGCLLSQRTRIGEAEQWYVRAERLAPGDASVCRHYGKSTSSSLLFVLHDLMLADALELIGNLKPTCTIPVIMKADLSHYIDK